MRRFFFGFLVVLVSVGCSVVSNTAYSQVVKTGIDVLESNGFAQLRGKRVGLVTNPTGVNRNLVSTIDILFNAPGVELVALFGPEHGVRGEAHAGDAVKGNMDAKTGLPIYSLYGNIKKPAAEMLQGLDAIVYDIQDTGCRSYTYISTMGGVMEVAAEHGIEVVILDRPNPLSGNKVEGPLVEDGFYSFVSKYNIPYIYGLTCGELAQLLCGEGMVPRCSLSVVKMEGWKRDMFFEETGLPWVLPSPHIPTPTAAYLYPATGILGELGVISIGIGYTLPFQIIGSHGVDADLFASAMNALELPGVTFRPLYYTPFYAYGTGKTLGGVQIHITDLRTVRLTEIQFYAIQELIRLYPDKAPFAAAAKDRCGMFDKVTGSDYFRTHFEKRYSFSDISDRWHSGEEAFRSTSAKYYLY